MANTASDVIAAARSEIGYSRWSDPQAGTKYGRWYASLVGESYYGTSGVPYCAMFVSWIFNKVGASCVGIPGAYTPTMVAAARKAGKTVSKSNAQPGDVVYFDWGGDGVVDHVGIVESNLGNSLQTIEGNTTINGSSGAVGRRSRAYSVVNAIVRPDYSSAAVKTAVSDKLDVDGWGGPLTIAKLQSQLGTTVDGVLSGQDKDCRDYLGHLWSVDFGAPYGSEAVAKLQKSKLNLNDDGVFGYYTAYELQRWLINAGYDVGIYGADHLFGGDSVKALQRALNDGKLK